MSTRVRPWLAAGWTAAIALVSGVAAPADSQRFPPPLTEQQAREVRVALDAMRHDPRGPYFRIRWFCADGAVLAPEPYACRERGGGNMYAQYNDQARRLAQLHFHVGTILQATARDSLYDAGFDHHWLKELVLQQFLTEVDDGWVLRRARFYRGAKQIEDEEARGQELLEWLLSDRTWTAANFLLASRLVAVVPHAGVGGDRTTERIRNLAAEVADMDSRFMPLRIKIHSFPSRDDLDSVEARLARSGGSPALRGKIVELRDLLRLQYDPHHTIETLAWYRRRVPGPLAQDVAALEESYRRSRPIDALQRIATLSPRLRQQVTESADGRRNLVLMDLNRGLLQQAFVLTQELDDRAGSRRRDRLANVSRLIGLAFASGLLSARETRALEEEIQRLERADSLTALEFRNSIAYLSRSLDWSGATVRAVFGPVIERYAVVEPKAIGFVDAELRSSILLPLSQELGRLAADADRVLGTSHSILGERVSHGVRGLNAGVALRQLEVVPADRLEVEFDQTRIYVLPATTPELRPVAGVLTLDEGNLLSHVQLLARNLGIPNAAVAPSHLPLLLRGDGRRVFFAVSPLGRVVLKQEDQLTGIERTLLEQGRQTRADKVRLDVSRLRLDRVDPIPLAELRADQSGVWVGPKAANLGQLAFYFPGRVSAGVALPFGLFARHVDRPFGAATRTVLEELDDAYREAAAMRAAGQSEHEIDQFVFGRLARVRQAILELPWQPEVRAAVERAVRETFGARVRDGVFVRSDTNVEDLPQFSGAGLNLTVPQLVTEESILEAVRRVWTSPFSERAYLWRKQILEDDGRIYPSVLLLQTVHSEKSGVLITSGLEMGAPQDLTIAVAEGVGGAVEGEDAETIIVRADGSIRLLSQAKAPARRALQASGGSLMVPAKHPEVLLQASEIQQLRDAVQEWNERFAPESPATVWDIEFGFVRGELWLFQVRPFVRFRSSALLERLRVLDDDMQRNAGRLVSLEEAS